MRLALRFARLRLQLAAKFVHQLVERTGIALLGPALFGAHLKPAQFHRIRLVAHLAGRYLDDRALLRRKRREHFALQALQETAFQIDIYFHWKRAALSASGSQKT